MKLVTNARVFALLIVTGATVAVPSYAAGPHKIGPSDPAMVSALASSAIPTFQLGQVRAGFTFNELPSEINSAGLFFGARGAGSLIGAGNASNNNIGLGRIVITNNFSGDSFPTTTVKDNNIRRGRIVIENNFYGDSF